MLLRTNPDCHQQQRTSAPLLISDCVDTRHLDEVQLARRGYYFSSEAVLRLINPYRCEAVLLFIVDFFSVIKRRLLKITAHRRFFNARANAVMHAYTKTYI